MYFTKIKGKKRQRRVIIRITPNSSSNQSSGGTLYIVYVCTVYVHDAVTMMIWSWCVICILNVCVFASLSGACLHSLLFISSLLSTRAEREIEFRVRRFAFWRCIGFAHTNTWNIYIYIMIVCGNCKCVLARWSIHHDARAKRKWTQKITVSCFCPVLACNYNRKIRTQQSLSSINMIIIRNQSIYRMCTVAVATKNNNLCNKWNLFDCVPTFLL